jgi:hypothetical protein
MGLLRKKAVYVDPVEVADEHEQHALNLVQQAQEALADAEDVRNSVIAAAELEINRLLDRKARANEGVARTIRITDALRRVG